MDVFKAVVIHSDIVSIILCRYFYTSLYMQYINTKLGIKVIR